MNNLVEYFHTDWQAMTVTDWVGTILTVAVFLLMVGAYVQVFRPRNRERLEAMKHIPFEEDDQEHSQEHSGVNDGRK